MSNETILFLILFLTFVLCDILLYYTYLANTQTNFEHALKALFKKNLGFVIVNNILHSILIVLFLATKEILIFILLIINISVYLYPNLINKILEK